MAKLVYADVSAITYRAIDIILRLTPEQQSLVIQALAVYNDAGEWQDYETYSDDIDALVAASEYALQVDEDMGNQTSFWLESRQVKRGVNDAGNAVAIVNNVNAFANYYVNQSPYALDDQCHYMLFIEAGDYYLRHTWHRMTDAGILTIALIRLSDNTVVPTSISALDMRGAALFNQITEGTFTIDESGAHKLVFAINATSSGASYRHAHSNTYVWRQEVII